MYNVLNTHGRSFLGNTSEGWAGFYISRFCYSGRGLHSLRSLPQMGMVTGDIGIVFLASATVGVALLVPVTWAWQC